MSGSTIGGVVGGVIGWFIGGPAGAQWGFMIGSAVGGYVDPVKVQGPRLQDAMKQTGQEGVPIPFGYGTFPTAGNIIWTDEVKEHKKSQRQGKGGAKTTTYTYTRSYAIGICEGPIDGILIVKRNGKVVWDARVDAEFTGYPLPPDDGSPIRRIMRRAYTALNSAQFGFKAKFYLGDEAQLPDPTIEAVEGVGKVAAFRGLAYMVVKDDDVTDLQGAIPQYEFVVATSASVGEGVVAVPDGSPEGSGLSGSISAGQITTYETTRSISYIRGAFRFAITKNYPGPARARVYSGSTLLYDTGWLASTTFAAELPTDLSSVSYWLKVNGNVGTTDPEQIAALLSDLGSGYSGDAPTHSPTFAAGIDSVRIECFQLSNSSGQSGIQVLIQHPDPAALPESVEYLEDLGLLLGSDGVLYRPSWVEDADLPPSITPTAVQVSNVIKDICARVQVGEDEIDTLSLASTLVDGYKVATESGADGMIAALMPAFFFDAGEYDGKLHFTKRGGNATFSIGPGDLAERDGEAMTLERVQEAELLRKVTVGHIDPLTQYTSATQAYERRAGTVEAKGESAIEVPIVCTHTVAAQIAEKRLKVAWSETEKLTFSLPALRWSRLTPTDVGMYYPAEGAPIRFRIGQIEEDSGVYLIEATRDRQAAYIGTATGVLPPPPLIVDLPIPGPAKLAVMDLPVLRETDDQLGLYVALQRYGGAVLQLSTDEGATSSDILQSTGTATIGSVVQGIGAWVNAEYPSIQSLRVRLPDAPESVSREAVLKYANRVAVRTAAGWEVLQFQSVATNDDGSYTLSGLLRGRYNTTPATILAGAQVVVLDGDVQFVPIESYLLGRTVKVRAVPIGTDPDAVAWTDVAIPAAPATQREWPVHRLRWERDGDGDLLVTWIGRARLGTSAQPRHSQYFAGYRVTVSNGATAKTWDTTEEAFLLSAADQVTTWGAADFEPTITVVPVNRLTGATGTSAPTAAAGTLDDWAERMGAGGWSISGGVITYDPVAGGDARGILDSAALQPFRMTNAYLPRFNMSVTVAGQGASLGSAGATFYDEAGAPNGGASGDRVASGTSDVEARAIQRSIWQVGPSLYAWTDGTHPVSFSNLRYSIT